MPKTSSTSTAALLNPSYASQPSLSKPESVAIKAFLSRFTPSNQSVATELGLLYGLSALLSTHGLKNISQIEALAHITERERKWVVAALQTEAPGRAYWNGQSVPWSKGPGPVTGTSRQNHGRKDVLQKYPFADPTSSSSRLIRQSVPVPLPPPPKPQYSAMNAFGVPPLFSLDSRVRANIVTKTFQEYNFSARGMKKTDVEEALK